MSTKTDASKEIDVVSAPARRRWQQPRIRVIAGRDAEASIAYGGPDGGFFHS